MKSNFLLGFLVAMALGTSFSYAQGIEPQLAKTHIRGFFFLPGLSVEQKIGSRQTINIQAGLDLFGATTESNNDESFEFGIAPYGHADIRHYYNRKSQSKELNNNSGNYVALAGRYVGERFNANDNIKESVDDSFYLGPVWGIQRSYKTGFFLNLNVGVAYRDGKYLDGGINGIANLDLGFYLR